MSVILPSRRRPTRPAAAAAAFVLGLAGLVPFAHAQSHDLTVVARTHVDAPKTFWDNGHVALRSEFEDHAVPLDTTLTYAQKAYWGDDESGPQQQYMFTVPDKGSELNFLGKPGDTWWMTSKFFSWGAQVWPGFGADTAVPADTFRDESFSLDLLDAEGPGRIEWFDWTPARGSSLPYLERLLSTHDPALRTSELHPGAHRHMYTAFSKPGRYHLTFRASARLKDGTLVSSSPTTMDWQVGGPEPTGKTQPPVAEQYAGAPATKAPASYAFSVADLKDAADANDARYAAKLTRWSFTTGEATAQGTAHVFVDGYPMAQLAVKDGKADLVQYASLGSARYQVVFVPAEGEGHGTRWASKEVTYAHGTNAATPVSVSTDAAAGEGDMPAPRPDEQAPAALHDEIHVAADAPYTATLKPGSAPGTSEASIDFADKSVEGFVRLQFFAKKGDTYADSDRMGVVHAGHWSDFFERPDFVKGMYTKLTFVPHTQMANLTSSVLDVADAVDLTKTYSLTGTAQRSGSASPAPLPTDPTGDPTATPTPTATGTTPGASTTEPGHPERKVLDHGHVDMQAHLTDGKLSADLKDDTGILSPESTHHELDAIAFGVHDKAKLTRGESMSAPEWDFLGPIGSSPHVLPMTEKAGLIWPGYSTETIDYGQLRGSVQLHLDKVSGPGDVRMFRTKLTGAPTVTFDSADPAKHVIDLPAAAHVHNAWAFTKPGVYDVSVRYTATGADGAALDSGTHTVRFLVGDEAMSGAIPAPSSSAPPTTSTTSSPTPTTSAPVPTTSTTSSPTPTTSAPVPTTSTTSSPTPTTSAPSPSTTTTSSPSPTTSSPSPTTSSPSPTTSTPAPPAQHIDLDHGHADIFDVVAKDGKPVLQLMEDVTALHTPHRPEDVTLRVNKAAWSEIPAGYPGAPGAYLLPLTQQDGLLWPGWNTLDSREGRFGPIDVVIDRVEGPGTVSVFSQNFDGSPLSLLRGGGYSLPGTISVPEPAHVHANWTFSAPGTYRMTVKAVTTRDGQRLETAPATYTWVVEQAPGAGTPTTGTPTASPTMGTPTTSPTTGMPTAPGTGGPTDTPTATPTPTDGGTPGNGVTPDPVQPGPVQPGPVKPGPVAPYPAKPDPAPPAVARPSTGVIGLSKGHTDLFYVVPGGGGLDMMLREDVTGSGVLRRPEDVRLLVGDNALMTVPAGLPEGGSRAYVLPMTQNPALLWPGWSTERLREAGLGAADIDVSVSGPGRVSVFSTGFAGRPASVLTSGGMSLPGRIHVPSPAHVHANWIFSAPGTYTLTARASASGQATRTATYTFVVGDSAVSGTVGGLSKVDGGSAGSYRPAAAGSAFTGGTAGGLGGAAAGTAGAPPAKAGTFTRKDGPVVDGVCTKQGDRKGLPEGAITSGHFDLGPIVEGGAVHAMVKDDRNAPAMWRDPKELVFGLGDAAKHQAPADLSFLTKEGGDVWMIGSTQEDGVPWLGENSQHASVVDGTQGPVRVTVTGVQGPGQVAHFLAGPLGGGIGEKLFDTVGGPTSYTIPANTHEHGVWAFSKPGEYKIDVTQSVLTKEGKTLEGAGSLTIVAGGCGDQVAAAAAPGGDGQQAQAAPAAQETGWLDGKLTPVLLGMLLLTNLALIWLVVRRGGLLAAGGAGAAGAHVAGAAGTSAP